MAEAIDQNREIKQRAMRRMGVAVVLVLAAVGILTYLSYYKPPKVAPKPVAETLPPPPPPIVTGPAPEAIQPAPAEAPLPPPDTVTPPPAAAPAPAATPAAPPPPTVVSKPLPKPGPGPKKDSEQTKPLVKAEKPAPAPAAPAPQAAPAAAPTPAPAVAPAAAPAKPAPNGYIVQFGVFSSMQNAAQLVERLKQLGIDAQTETKVHLPAFKSKAEADAALAKMKEKGISAVVVAK